MENNMTKTKHVILLLLTGTLSGCIPGRTDNSEFECYKIASTYDYKGIDDFDSRLEIAAELVLAYKAFENNTGNTCSYLETANLKRQIILNKRLHDPSSPGYNVIDDILSDTDKVNEFKRNNESKKGRSL
jgi:hypothetical protein